MDISKSVRSRIQTKKAPVAQGVGRRKSAVARVWITHGDGAVLVNGKKVQEYFDTEMTRQTAVVPLSIMPVIAKQYDVNVNVSGSGLCAQADAMKLGIARAFVSIYEDTRSLFRTHPQSLLTVDARVKERKKYGQEAARRQFQFVKR